MSRSKTIFVAAICALWISDAKASLQMDWQIGTLQSVLPAGISGSSDAIAVQSENDGMSFLNGAGSLTSGGVSGDISKPGAAFAAIGTKNSDGGGNFAASGDIQFTTAAITPVPEPTSYALAFFGLAFGLGGAGRFYLSWATGQGRRRRAELKPRRQ